MTSAAYATLTDLGNHGLPSSSWGTLSPGQIQAMLDARNAYATGKMAGRYSMPLLPPFDPMIVAAVCHLTAYDAIVVRGYDPSNPGDRTIETRYLAAIKFFDDVQRQTMHPSVNESAAPTAQAPPQYAAPLIVGQPLQGWMPGQVPDAGPFPPSSGTF